MTRLDLLRVGPYRIFFPLGALAGILGVGHWLVWTLGWIPEGRSFFHAQIQIEGFLICFVAGFLMTAIPKFIGSQSATLLELSLSLLLETVVLFSLATDQFVLANSVFIAFVISLIVFVGRRLPKRTKSPPSSFLLIGFGLLQAILGPSFILLSGIGQRSFVLMEIGRQMLQLGFMLCMVLGIAGYLAPFLMGYAADPSCDPKATPIRGTSAGAILFHGISGFLIVISFLGTSEGAMRLGSAVRAVVACVHMLAFAKIARPVINKRAYVYFFWMACWMVPLGLIGAALWPEYRIANLHLLFIGGFSLMIFSFGLMVVASHGAEADLLNGRLIPLKIVGIFVLLAAVMRVAADLDSWHYRLWLHSASGSWVIAAGLWLIYILPKVYRIPPQLMAEPFDESL